MGGRDGEGGGTEGRQTTEERGTFSARHSVARDWLNSVVFMVAACWGPSPACVPPLASLTPPASLLLLHPPPLQPEWVNTLLMLIPHRRQAEAWRHKREARSEESKASRSPAPLHFPVRTCAPDVRPQGPSGRAPQPLTPALHADTTLAAPSCPGHPPPSRPPPSLTSSARSGAHAHLSSPLAPQERGRGE